jgi:glycosyltransferase involved in cell wall biosynthesis
MKRILILEIGSSGHRATQLRWILESRIAEEAHITVAGPRDLLEHRELADSRTKFTPLELMIPENVQLVDTSLTGLIRREFAVREIYGRAYREEFRRRGVDIVAIPFVDVCTNAMALRGAPFGGAPWFAISMRTQFHLQRMGVIAPEPKVRALREWLFRRLLKQRSLVALLTIDPTLVEYGSRDGGKEFEKLRYLPDPSESLPLTDKSGARAQLGVPAEARLVLAYGGLSERKGIFQLMHAMASGECPRTVHLLLAGVQDQAFRNFMEGSVAACLIGEGRLHILPGYVPNEMVPLLLSASDAMWIGYIDFYTMSGVMVLAARHSLPVIASAEGIVGYLAARHRVGITVNPRSETSVIAVLRQIAAGSVDLKEGAERAFSMFAGHTHVEFQRVIAAAVNECAGIASRISV